LTVVPAHLIKMGSIEQLKAHIMKGEKSMEQTKKLDIYAIEELTEQEAREMALETLEIKGHTVYMVDLGGHFGYSALVFADGHQIRFANDYELHYNGKSREELWEIYLEKLNGKLFAESELETVTDYDDYRVKADYLHNHYGLRRDYISMWYFCKDEAERKAAQKQIKGMVYNPVAFAYYKPEDSDFVKHHAELLLKLEAAQKKLSESYDYWLDAFYYEMCNHEYGINWQADFDVIGCFANVDGVRDYENREKLMEAAGFGDIQKSAYAAAIRKYHKAADENGWG